METKTTLIAIDPGTRKCGIALFRRKSPEPDKLIRHFLIRVGKKPGKTDWIRRSVHVTATIAADAREYGVTHAVIEMPSHRGGLTGAAARNSSSILKLMFLVGNLHAALVLTGVAVDLVGVARWKGQAPKEITAKRVARRWGLDLQQIESLDVTDAIGLGTWWLAQKSHGQPK